MNTQTILGVVAAAALTSTAVVGGLYVQKANEVDEVKQTVASQTTQQQNRYGEHDQHEDDHKQGPSSDTKYHDEYLDELPKQELSEEERDGLLLMREEEKLARDVYITLYNKWNSQVFNNISESEQRHTDMVADLLQRYDLEDPVKSDDVGKFTNTELLKLYGDLVAQGEKSLADAFTVGATIEDLDIYDLERLIDQTDNEDIIFVYDNLHHGSENHMRAFVRQLEREGKTYTAQFISQEELDEILNADYSRGNRGGRTESETGNASRRGQQNR